MEEQGVYKIQFDPYRKWFNQHTLALELANIER
jgi:hypothetical protein